MIDQSTIDKILDRVDIVQEIGSYIELKKSGSDYSACCPFHEEKTPSFHVSPARQMWHCFGGCSEGGNVIKFVMKIEGLSFPEAVRKLAEKYGIEVEGTRETAEDTQARMEIEAMQGVNERIFAWYREQIRRPEYAAAWNEAVRRWGTEYLKEGNIGYAPDSFNALINHAAEKGEKAELLLKMGLIRRNEQGNLYDFYRNRLMIPIRDRIGKIIGFTARDFSGKENVPKYLNSSESPVYKKGQTVFGMDVAVPEARKKGYFILVEGAADAIKMHSVGIYNAVAPLGGYWTDAQFKVLKRYADEVCFINDADPVPAGKKYGTGIDFVIKNGENAMKQQLNVSVRELPCKEGNLKQDPGDFFDTKGKINQLEKENFILFVCSKIFGKGDDVDTRTENVKKIAAMVATITDDMKINILIPELTKFVKGKEMWQQYITQLKWDTKKVDVKKNGGVDLRQYGFYEEHGAYFSQTEKGGDIQWSNFTMKPLFHIKDKETPKRLYYFKNMSGREEIVELSMEDLNSVSKFRQKIEGIGNFIWMATEREMIKLKNYLYDNTQTAVTIKQMGWNSKGFYCFGNGIWCDGNFQKADEFGICRINEQNWYIPAASRLNKDDNLHYERERRFIHTNLQTTPMAEYLQKFVDVFGDNGKVGLMYLVASLFRDIIMECVTYFPLLNLFGPKGSGKTEFGSALMSFFTNKNEAPNIRNATAVALNDDVAFSCDAMVHFDEYKNDMDSRRIEFLKGTFDGVGRTKMSGNNFDSRIMTKVKTGVIVSGQEIPTADIALFTRLIFLSFPKSEFSNEERRKYNELKEIRQMGLTSYTLSILELRKRVDNNFMRFYKEVTRDVMNELHDESLETRIIDNWVKALAAWECTEDNIRWPMNYSEMLKITVEGIKNQNAMSVEGNEISGFWDFIMYLRDSGEIFMDGDYRIDSMMEIKTSTVMQQYAEPKKLLLLNTSRIFYLYKKGAVQMASKALPVDALQQYLKNENSYLGVKNAVRFKSIIKGYQEREADPDTGRTKPLTKVSRAMVFDYRMLQERYGINLEMETENPYAEIETQSESNREEARQKSLF